MDFPAFIRDFSELDIPFESDVVSSNAIGSDQGIVAFFTFHKAMHLPAHSHGAQWGTVVAGEIVLTIAGETKTYRPGESYSIAAGEVHSADISAGTRVIDVFEEPDRYSLK